MIDEAFCLAGLLKTRESFQRVVCLLPPGRQEAVLQLTEELSALSTHELQRKLCALRESAVLRVKTRLTEKFGVGWRELSPLLQRWLGEVVLRTHGS